MFPLPLRSVFVLSPTCSPDRELSGKIRLQKSQFWNCRSNQQSHARAPLLFDGISSVRSFPKSESRKSRTNQRTKGGVPMGETAIPSGNELATRENNADPLPYLRFLLCRSRIHFSNQSQFKPSMSPLRFRPPMLLICNAEKGCRVDRVSK